MQVTISSKFQVVIPREIRKTFKIQPGEIMEIIPHENRLEFIKVKNINDMRGFLQGIDTTAERDGDRV
ncbi:MAG: AbrB/MazE/SpoVT family DNA-binding domain-containing protein [Candidatus Latescibacterota bacterium]